jgi:hypothetical protein
MAKECQWESERTKAMQRENPDLQTLLDDRLYYGHLHSLAALNCVLLGRWCYS